MRQRLNERNGGFLFEVKSYKASTRDGVLSEVEGPIQRADVENGNKRKYPRSVWEKCLRNETVVERVRERAMVGELDHPQEGTSSYPRVSHVMTEVALRPDGVIWGKADILDTPHGRIADTLFRAKVRTGISSRGDGSTREDESEGGITVVEDDYIPETWDFVVNPSTPGAFMTQLQQYESRQQIANALTTLVNETQDQRVLSESQKIIKELGGDKAGDPLKPVYEAAEQRKTQLREALGRTGQSQSNPIPLSEEHVSTNQPQGDGGLAARSPEIAALANSLAESQIAAFRSQVESHHYTQQQQIVEMSSALTEAGKRQAAAEALIDEFAFRSRKLKEERDQAVAAAQNPQGAPQDARVAQLEAELTAAKGLLEAAIKAIEKLKGTQVKAQAAESLVSAMIEHMRSGKRRAHIESLVRGNPAAGKLKRVLEGLGSIRQINETYSAIAGFSGPSFVREPLPGQQVSLPPQGRLTESTSRALPPAPGGGDAVMAGLLGKVGGV